METKKSDENNLLNAVAYLIFFLPLLINSESKVGKFHANQGLSLLLLTISVSIIGSVIPLLGWFIILPIGSLMCLIFAIMGIINAINGEMKPLPLIGKIQLIK